MKTHSSNNRRAALAAALATTLSFHSGAQAAELTVEPAIPTENLIVERGDGAPEGTAPIQQTFGFRNADDVATAGTRGRGQSFVINSTPGASYSISSLAVSLNASGDDAGYRPDGELTLTIFEWDGADADDFSLWGQLPATPGQSGALSGMEVFRQAFPIPTGTTYPATDFLTIAFDEGELSLKDGTPYGFFFLYTLNELVDADGNPLDEDVTIAFDSDNGAADAAAGALLSTNPSNDFATAPNSVSASRDLNYFITGTTVEGDFAISAFDYDPTTTDVTLTWGTTAPGEAFEIRVSADLIDWGRDLNDSFPADAAGDETTGVFNLNTLAPDLVGAPDLFFRIQKAE